MRFTHWQPACVPGVRSRRLIEPGPVQSAFSFTHVLNRTTKRHFLLMEPNNRKYAAAAKHNTEFARLRPVIISVKPYTRIKHADKGFP